MALIELLLIGFLVWGIISAVPLILDSTASGVATRPNKFTHAVFRLASTTKGKLWIQRGLSEIVTVEIATGEVRTAFRQNQKPIFRSSVSEDGATCLLSLDNREIVVFRDQKLVVSETFPNTCEMEMALSGNGQFVVRVTDGTHMRCWDLATPDLVPSDFELSDAAERIALDSLGEQLLIATKEGNLVLYDARTGGFIQRLCQGEPLSGDPLFSPDGSRLLALRGRSIEQYDIKTLKLCWRVDSPDSDEFRTIAISPDGSKIATVDYRIGIQIRDSTDGRVIHKLSQQSLTNKIAFANSSQTLYSASLDGSIRTWSLATGAELEPLSLIH